MEYKLKRIMLVDDSEIDLRVNARLLVLSQVCTNIQTFNAADQALEYLKLNSHQPDHLPDAIFLDIQMPYVDGFGFLDQFNQLPKQVKDRIVIFVLSSTLDFGNLKRAEANPLVAKMFKKPLNIHELKRYLTHQDITA